MDNKLFVADTHLTNKPSDEYRWALFHWLKKWVVQYGVKEVWILGDLTDAKEGHDAVFVNRLVSEIEELAEYADVFILRGNHDYLLRECAFFEFLDKLPHVTWIDEVREVGNVLCFPHSKNPWVDWDHWLDRIDEFDYAVFHQCFVGSRSSLGHILDGTDLDLKHLEHCKVYAGDIHLPQTVGGIEYVGSPYPTTYGDRFLGRCLLHANGERKQLHLPTIQKCTLVIEQVSELYEARIYPDDQVKIRFNLSKDERSNWTNIKQQIKDACKDLGVYLGGIELLSDSASKEQVRESIKVRRKTSENDILKRFAASEDLPDDYLAVAMQIMEE